MPVNGYAQAPSTSLAAQLRDGRATVPELVTEALLMIDSLDTNGPQLASVLAVNQNAEAEASARQLEIDAGTDCGPLHGIPVLIKDNIDTRGPMPTTAGSLALADSPPASDATLVERLRTAGAIVVGKANMSEWGNFRAARSTRGWSAVRGLVRNPYLLDRSAAGSSSGSAAAVAAGIVPMAIGTETDGSIVAPAAVNGIVGLKPTVGLVSQSGIVPISHNQDTAGPMARSVRDVAILLDAITEGAPRQPIQRTRLPVSRYVEFCDIPNLDSLSVGLLPDDWTAVHPAAHAALDAAVRVLARQGVRVVENVPTPGAIELAEADYELTVMLYDCKWDINTYLSQRKHPTIRNIADVIEFNHSNADVELQYFGQDLLERAAAMGSREEPEYLAALENARRCGGPDGIDYAMTHGGVDCVLVPGFGPAWKSDLICGDGPDLNHMASPAQTAATAGYPVLTVPAGDVGGLPVGVTLIGAAWTEGTLIRLAHAIERDLDAKLTPTFAQPRTG